MSALSRSLLSTPALRWPVPALLAWAAAWIVTRCLAQPAGPGAVAAVVGGLATGAAAAMWAGTFWRRAIVAGGFPLSLLMSGAAAGVPAWAWLLPLAALALAYPVSAWRDAPVFPTPRGALTGLADVICLPEGARLLDAGCGLGHGLRALRGTWPGACVTGVERSWPLALLARLACPWAEVRRGDMWAGSWAGFDLVYLFQRPESMARAHARACAEMRPGSWLVSLEFEVPGQRPHAVLQAPGGRPVRVYRVPEDALTSFPDTKVAAAGRSRGVAPAIRPIAPLKPPGT